ARETLMRSMTSAMRLAVVAAVLGLAFAAAAQAATYTRGDLLYVVYKPSGSELIVNLGSKDNFVNATGPISVPQVGAADLTDVFGPPLPTNLRAAVFGSADVDAYIASNGPTTVSKIGSALGASNQIQAFGGRFASSSRPSLTNPDAGSFLFSDSINYQKSLNG